MNEILNNDDCSVEKSRIILNQLQKLGYKYPFASGSYIPLLEKLIGDVMTLKEEVEQYKNLIKKVEKEKHNLEKGLIPYKQDNGRLALENSDLHEQLFEWEQKYEKLHKEFKKKDREYEHKLADLEFISKIASQRVKNLEKNNKTLSLAYKNLLLKGKDAKGKGIPISFEDIEPFIEQGITKNNLSAASDDQANINSVNETNNKMNRETAELLEEIEDLKLDNQHQAEIIAALKCQLAQKDREMCRLRHTLEGGRPLSAVTRDCCQQCIDKDSRLKSLEEQLKEAVDKQHEAMSRALHLAEKNQHLERELKDIDNIALAVEKECQNKVKNNLKNIDVVEEKLRQKNIEIKKLEETIMNMRNKIERDELELENLRKEKQMLEKNLHAATGEKKHLNDKINYFLLIEKNLNAEIARMQEINKSLQRQICDMESRVMDILGTNCKGHQKDKQKKPNLISEFSGSKSHTAFNSQLSSTKIGKDCKKHCNDDCFQKNSCASLLDKVQQERDFYHNECHRLKDQLGSLSFRTDNNSELMRQIKELEKEIINLKQENFALRRENSVILKRTECSDHLSCSSGDSFKIILDRLEKERDLALSDISRLQGERDALKERIKLAAETHVGEQSRFEKIIRENEERIRRLEAERRELISSQSSQRVSLASMEEKCDDYKENMRKAHCELAQMKANYCQLKSLQEKTDRSLAELQSRHDQTEMELRVAANKIQDLERINGNLEKEMFALKKEKTDLMSSVTFIEKEKDGLLITLDEKTEKVAKLEGHIKKQEAYVSELMEKITHLEKKLEFTLTEKTNREYGFRSLEREVERLKEELQQCMLQKEALTRENGRLQDDLAAAAKDCLTARRELDAEKQDVENLKKQLQQYVTEVKKAEELLSKKEAERNEMLEHFRSLSIEATTLETNNHTLESTVENTKTELITSQNKIADLEREIASKETLLYNYEKQIAELTTQIAELESKLKIQTEMRMRAEEDLKALRDLCSTLDGQKEALKRVANSQDAEKIQLINEVRRLSEEYEGLNQKLTHERSLSQTLEKSLSNSRQETLEHKITNKDLQMHVHHLKQKVDELTHKLESESQDVRRYQAQCAELSQQVSELRREVTNARFEHARTKEDSRRLMDTYRVDDECHDSEGNSFKSQTASCKTFTWSPERMKKVAVVAAAAAAETETPVEMKFVFSRNRPNQWESSPLETRCLPSPDKFRSRMGGRFFREHCYPSDSVEFDRERSVNSCPSYQAGVSVAEHDCMNLDVSQCCTLLENSKLHLTQNFFILFDNRSLTQCCHSDEEAKETYFEETCLANSSRNIPPLNFPDDSDRTVSLDSDTENLPLLLTEDPENFLRKPYWKLSPVAENLEGKSNSNTASTLSSLPEDNGKSTENASLPEDDKTEESVYPTYSIRGERRGDDCGEPSNFGDEEIGRIEMHTPEGVYRTGCSGHGLCEKQIDSDYAFEKHLWETATPVEDDTGDSDYEVDGQNSRDNRLETSTITRENGFITGELDSPEVWDNASKRENFFMDEILSEIDENTFSLSK